ncbi:acyltransferase family protein [Kitasatospora sp. NPDC057223]|uniref:acyltransferase family protein n=1 Tax=Kitasatospora sp. NPDC057223 TaxID=3346055 RepID=UPI00363EF067
MTPARAAHGAPARLPSLTALRFVAALLVFCFHATYENAFRDPDAGARFSQLFSKAGWVGVSFFFVLSGFLLTWSARPHDSARRFWRRRFFKIYPSHLLTALAALALMARAGQPRPGVLRNLLLVQTWTPDVDVILSVNPVSWSLACEALFYLAFPALLPAVRRIRPPHLWPWAGALTAAVLCVPLLARALLPAAPHMTWLAVSEQHYWFVFAFPPVRALEFLLGMVMARIVSTGRWRAPGTPTAALALAGAYALALRAPFDYGLAAVTLVPVTWLITAAAAADTRTTPTPGTTTPGTRRAGTRASPLRAPVMLRLGELSFAFYLTHRLVQVYGHRALGAGRTWSTPAAAALLAASALLTLLLAWLLHTAVERPVMRRFAAPRNAAPAPGAPGARPAPGPQPAPAPPPAPVPVPPSVPVPPPVPAPARAPVPANGDPTHGDTR